MQEDGSSTGRLSWSAFDVGSAEGCGEADVVFEVREEAMYGTSGAGEDAARVGVT